MTELLITPLFTELDKQTLYRRLIFLFRRTDEPIRDKAVSEAIIEINLEIEEIKRKRRVSDFVDDSDSRARFIKRQRKINELSARIISLIRESGHHFDGDDTHEAFERALQKMF